CLFLAWYSPGSAPSTSGQGPSETTQHPALRCLGLSGVLKTPANQQSPCPRRTRPDLALALCVRCASRAHPPHFHEALRERGSGPPRGAARRLSCPRSSLQTSPAPDGCGRASSAPFGAY